MSFSAKTIHNIMPMDEIRLARYDGTDIYLAEVWREGARIGWLTRNKSGEIVSSNAEFAEQIEAIEDPAVAPTEG